MAADTHAEMLWLARQGYCLERKSFAQVAGELGLEERIVRDWAGRFDWRREREELAEAEAGIRINTVKCRAHVLQKLLESESGADIARMAEAAVALNRLDNENAAPSAFAEPAPTALRPPPEAHRASGAAKKRPGRRKAAATPEEAAWQPEGRHSAFEEAKRRTLAEEAASESLAAGIGPEERIALLEEAVNRQLSHVLTHPVDDLSRRVKEIKAALDVLESLRGKAEDKAFIVSFEE